MKIFRKFLKIITPITLSSKESLQNMIFSHARSGSSTLNEILNIHPQICIFGEPFYNGYFINRKENSNDLKREIVSISDLQYSIKKIKEKFNGIKHVFTHLSRKYNVALLSQPECKIIFLERKNLLQSTVSSDISIQIENWNNNPVNWRKSFDSKELQPINKTILSLKIKRLKKEINFYLDLLRKKNINFYHVYYEDLYGSNIPIDEKMKIINDIFLFLGFHTLSDQGKIDRIKDLLNPNKYKLNSPETYKKISNILKIEEKLGCDETGWLFK